MTRWL